MEFADLNEEIIADDWLIDDQEIANKRLIKQTPKFNVYKADWFGSVLVYEPVSFEEQKHRCHQNRRIVSRRQQRATGSEPMSFQVLNKRLNSLNLDIISPITRSIDDSQLSPSSRSTASNDSAYSSISSTPHYRTKTLDSEFEFPSQIFNQTSPMIDTASDNGTSPDADLIDGRIIDISAQEEYKVGGSFKKQSREAVVVLNRDSFEFAADHSQSKQFNGSKPHSSWLELNELRLVAHESFMLFMGASVNKINLTTMTSEDTKSLVMQMNHPKAVSLHDLLQLHHGFETPISNRFFNFKHNQLLNQSDYLGKALSCVEKFNICKQMSTAMTYLHDKNIVHGKLNSVNIYLEQNCRVKISLLDDDTEAWASSSPRGGQLNLRSLAHMSPELIRSIEFTERIDDGQRQDYIRIDANQLTKKSDVFSFGTLLFELFEERLPSCDASASELIYQIGSGNIGAKNLDEYFELNTLGYTSIKSIIRRCWSSDLTIRPSFKQMNSMLSGISLAPTCRAC